MLGILHNKPDCRSRNSSDSLIVSAAARVSGLITYSEVANMVCSPVKPVSGAFASLATFTLDARSFRYQVGVLF